MGDELAPLTVKLTLNEDMGMPAGKPKTIAVDLRFLSASRRVRIVTNLCVYWDEIFLSEGLPAYLTRIQTNVAEAGFAVQKSYFLH